MTGMGEDREATIRQQDYAPREARWGQMGQRPVVAWLTGLPGAGKSSLAEAADRALANHGRHVFVLDGDNLRLGLCADLGFEEADRAENVRRAAEVALLMGQAGLVVLVALVSPSRVGRGRARAIVEAGSLPFLEVHVDTPLAVCEARDPKGLYARARAGRIAAFTGVSAPYEAPGAADLTLRTEAVTVAASAAPLVKILTRLSAAE